MDKNECSNASRGVCLVAGFLALIHAACVNEDEGQDHANDPIVGASNDASDRKRDGGSLRDGGSRSRPVFDAGQPDDMADMATVDLAELDGSLVLDAAMNASPQAGEGATHDAASAAADSSAGPPEDCPASPLGVGDHSFTLRSDNGVTYSYVISVPKSVDPKRKAPLKVVWHALWSSPEEERALASIDAKAEAAGMLLVYPRSPDQSWDVGSCCAGFVAGTPRDEEVFARELVKEVQSKVCVDEKRIYTTGFSNGGMISQVLACKMADVFAAATPMGSTLTIEPDQCRPSRPIPMLLLNGTADPLVGYEQPSFAGGISVPDDVAFWAAKNMCTGEPEPYLQKGKATCKVYKECAAGVELAYCSVEGMGHCLPGMKTESPTNCLTKNLIPLGMPNDDIDAMQLSNDFLARFSLP